MKGLACVGTTKVSLRRPWFHPEAVLYVPEDQGWRTRFLRNPLFFRILRIHAHVYFYIYIYIYLFAWQAAFTRTSVKNAPLAIGRRPSKHGGV